MIYLELAVRRAAIWTGLFVAPSKDGGLILSSKLGELIFTDDLFLPVGKNRFNCKVRGQGGFNSDIEEIFQFYLNLTGRKFVPPPNYVFICRQCGDQFCECGMEDYKRITI